ncbi:hypothetical protein [Actinomadura latina]|uniref:CU044_5270 family protein n=1 Tax=Actinomadura latina TaxID=163603 RepID=A0A846Z8H0_9ACTN|nr:hypothetical protein [Actinomadura latina]NKZ06885.1 hypothetical protein [Actinomadura latina]
MNMNEMDRVRGLLREPPPPSAEVSAKALAVLADEMAGKRVQTAGTGRRRFGFGWPAGLGTALVAAGAATAVAIALTGGGTPGSPESPAGVDLGKDAVLAAAAKVELTPTGEYWYTDRLDGQSYIVRAKTGTYAIVGAASESFSWTGLKKGTGEAYYGRDLPARPLTAQDEAAWKKAGSPSTFRVWSNDHYSTYTAKATKWRSDGPEVGIDPKGGGEFLGKPAAEWQNLPTDPSKLAAMFLNDAETRRGMGLPEKAARKVSASQAASAKIWRASSILGGTPVPPKVRAGLMRALAAQPGIDAIGRTTDPLGREGVALASGERTVTVTGEYGGPKAERGTYRHRQVIVFDERTGELLSVQDELTGPGGPYAEMKPGFVINYVAIRSSGWTDTKPKPPAELPS